MRGLNVSLQRRLIGKELKAARLAAAMLFADVVLALQMTLQERHLRKHASARANRTSHERLAALVLLFDVRTQRRLQRVDVGATRILAHVLDR